MATDYDAPRHPVDDVEAAETVGAVTARHADTKDALAAEPDPFETGLDLPDVDLAGDDLTVSVLPRQADEFTCTVCYLVRHRSQIADEAKTVCRDCA